MEAQQLADIIGDGITINLDEMTLGDIEDVEDIIGSAFGDVVKPGQNPRVRVTRALLWVALRREHPEISFDDLRNLTPTVLGNVAMGEPTPSGKGDTATE